MKYAALVFACAPLFAFAQSSNTITFTGEVAQSTCNVTINGSSGASIIRLPSQGKNEFIVTGTTAGWTKFDMALSGCTTSNSNFSTKFTPGQVSDGKNIKNTASSNNVHLQLTQVSSAGDKGPPITFTSGPVTVSGGVFTGSVGSKSGAVSYGVQYISEGIASAGKVAGTATYSFVYN